MNHKQTDIQFIGGVGKKTITVTNENTSIGESINIENIAFHNNIDYDCAAKADDPKKNRKPFYNKFFRKYKSNK